MISKQTLATLPDRPTLRALYDTVIAELDITRPHLKLSQGFYAETANSVFEAGYLALSDHCKGPDASQRVHTVSAPAGGGKTTFSYAFIKAVTQYAEGNPEAPYGCVLVVDQIKKADDAYRDLNGMMPGKVAVWTTEHDKKRASKPGQIVPSAEFTQDELRLCPIVVVTHQCYNGPRGHKTRVAVMPDGQFSRNRALAVVDERPEEVDYFEIAYDQAQRAREALQAKCPDLEPHLSALLLLMAPYTFGLPGSNEIGRYSDAWSADFVEDQLQWFTTEEAARVLKGHGGEIAGLDQLFGYARALMIGHAIAVPEGTVVRYVGWQGKPIMRAGVGTMLLDATADIDGVSQIVPWRTAVKVPTARYDNLEIIHVPQHTKKRLKQYLAKAANQRAYVQYIEDIIRTHVRPGERALVVCKKVLFDAERIPTWPDSDQRFKTPTSYTSNYAWEIEGRHLCATHWGTGIGRNDWHEADVVLLFDEFYIPRRVAVATVQAYRGHRADQGALGSMRTMSSHSPAVEAIAEGHRLRFTKQMALRGKGRTYDEHGMCGVQRLVVSSHLKSFMANASKLFPGAKITTAHKDAEGSTWADRVLEFLGRRGLPPFVTTKDMSAAIGREWRLISPNITTPQFDAAVAALGWRYVARKGRGGSRFYRLLPGQLQQQAA